MRRHLVLVAAVAALLVVSGCGSSDSSTKRTVTAVVTASSGAEAAGSEAGSAEAGSSAAPGSGASESAASGSAAASGGAVPGSPGASAGASSAGAVSPAPIVTVDPLKVDCGAILSAADVKKIFNVDIPNDRIKKTIDVTGNKVGQTGQVRCLYGLSADQKSGAFSMVLTQYTDPAAAQTQSQNTMQTLSDNGAQNVPATVSGYPATISLQDGGLIAMPYDNWTLAIASFSTTPIDPATLQTGLPQLAEAALARILKS
jgi:hypothetical protein